MGKISRTRGILAYNVPRFIQHIVDRGGVNEQEMAWLRSEDLGSLQDILCKADEYILYPETREKLEQGFFNLVLAIAILSFAPGGITFWGLHFDSKIEGCLCFEGIEVDGVYES